MPHKTPLADQISPLPMRLAWFAPWTWFANWKPWQRWMLFAVKMIAGYVLSPIPVIIVLDSILPLFGIAYPVTDTVYAPIWWACERCAALRAFYDFQWYAIFGVPPA